jgi:hypothetical protein
MQSIDSLSLNRFHKEAVRPHGRASSRLRCE